MKLFLLLLGLVLILEGLPYATFPEVMKKWLEKMLDTPVNQLRLAGFLAIGLGFFLCYLVQKTDLLN